ncbi:PREDICTED: uncharacterized protein LOC109337513 [Lupinus angustifolius]|uniref:uncharacterized protein LOC109337513 n=1 Tax=Lupinus angustifolius TaxID=3871 RepID=UPI00092E7556|nr:PREDICTED: uncharacterized protein LOC109337513 [Lupinus angustifolius]
MASKCNLCNDSQEDSVHLFFQCKFAMAIWDWFQFTFSINIANLNQKRFNDTTYSITQDISKIKRETSFSGICSKSPSASCNVAELMLLRNFQTPLRLSKAPRIVEVVWEMPMEDWIKANIDGAAKGSPGLAGAGGIFRSNLGKCIACFAVFIDSQFSLYAEVFAVQAVNWDFNNGWNNLWLECDSTTVVDIFNHKAKVLWKISNAWEQCKSKLLSINFHILHIFREGNTCVDKLANYAIDYRHNSSWNKSPTFIKEDYNRNRLGLPS